MDNITHTLVGGVLARAGFDRRTPLAAATMMIGANFPDIDVVAVAFGTELAVRRGTTHGVPALILLPFVLAGIMMLWDRHVRRRRDPSLPPAIPRELLLLSAISILTHPFFDWLNVYGMRWLMPMVDKWYYGDTLFIIDPWLLAILALGFVASGRTGTVRPARIALTFATAYIALMMVTTISARARVIAESGRMIGMTSPRLMVAPVAANPFTRQIILAERGRYLTGTISVLSGMIEMGESIPIDRQHPAVPIALRDPDVQRFMHWARFPYFRVEQHGALTTVHIADARYSDLAGRGWASVSVTVPTP